MLFRSHRFAAASSDGVGDDDVRAESDADEQVEDESGDGRVGADGRDRGGAVGLGELLAGPLLGMLNVTADVFPLALAYLRIYLIGMPVILLYNFETAIFRSIGDTQAPLAVRFRRHCSGGTKRGNRHAVL